MPVLIACHAADAASVLMLSVFFMKYGVATAATMKAPRIAEDTAAVDRERRAMERFTILIQPFG